MIRSPLLTHVQGLIAGEWASADSGETGPVRNPLDGSHLADVPRMGLSEVSRAIDAAQAWFESAPPVEQRRAWLCGIGDSLLNHSMELGRIVTLEHGKPHTEAVGEAEYAAGFFHFFASQLDSLRSHELANTIRDCRWEVHFRPAGVAGMITPWNLPLAMMAKKLAAAIAAGCGIVVKPASLTPLSAIACCAAIEDSGAPREMINLVIGRAAPIGEVLCTHPAVRIVSFTGSTETGRHLAALAAPHIKRLTMELGGHAPFMVFEDADVEVAADALIANKFRSGGQTCVCTNRVYVQRGIAESFTDLVVQRVKSLRVGNGLEPDTDLGPLIDGAGFDKVAAHVSDALQQGATRLVGHDPRRPSEDWGYFYPPTVLVGVHHAMRVCREETFGPVIAISTFVDQEDVLASANDTAYGLAAYLFTANEDRARQLTPRLRFGHVGINTGTGPTPEAPFGGMKHSGYGREGGLEGLLEFCEPQVTAMGT